MGSTPRRDADLRNLLAIEKPDERHIAEIVSQYGLSLLPSVARQLRRRVPIDELERVERVLKGVLRPHLVGPCDGPTARLIARFQMATGFMIKLKSYAIKAATPLGYSVFLQQPGEGFSFQRHIDRKTELFHILHAYDGAFVFMCEYEAWKQVYEPRLFDAWLAGEKVEQYERYCTVPRPGDVFVMDRLNVVHSVFGCILEEFATVSTDMVDRLHDQNRGRSIPSEFSRSHARQTLRALGWVGQSNAVVVRDGSGKRTGIPWVPAGGGSHATLGEHSVVAERYQVGPGRACGPTRDTMRAKMVHIWSGEGHLKLWGDGEAPERVSALPFGAGRTVMIPTGVWYDLVADDRGPLYISIHSIPAEEAM